MNRLTVNINISNDDGSFPFYVDVSFLYHRKYLTKRNTTCVLQETATTNHSRALGLTINKCI